MIGTRICTMVCLGFLLCTACSSKAPSVLPPVQQGKLKQVDKALRKGADVHEQDTRGYTALMIAADKGNVAIVHTLIDYDADVAAKDPKYGKTALHLAAANGHTSTVLALQLLLCG